MVVVVVTKCGKLTHFFMNIVRHFLSTGARVVVIDNILTKHDMAKHESKNMMAEALAGKLNSVFCFFVVCVYHKLF